MTATFHFKFIYKRNYTVSMGVSFFTSCPLTGGIGVPLHTLCTSNLSLSYRNSVRVFFDFAQDYKLVEWHLFEAASRLVFVRARLKKDISMLFSTFSFLRKKGFLLRMRTKCSQCNVAKKFQEINMLFLGYVIMDRGLVKSRLDIECLIG